jgi:ABC-2 type transport system ATP-binding protein
MKNESIEVRDLVKRFGAFTAVDHISFAVQRGEIFGFLGANGAGKTTAIRMLTGLLKPTSGQAMVAGVNVVKNREAVKAKIGYMSQRFSLYDDLTVRENIRFYAGIYGLKKTGLTSAVDELSDRLKLGSLSTKLTGELPLGWKQKIAFCVALIHKPSIVFLDEPTGGVDPVTRRQFWELIYETADQGVTVFVTTHYMDEAAYCDRISIMVDGRLAAIGAPANLKEEYDCQSMDELFIKLARTSKIRAG